MDIHIFPPLSNDDNTGIPYFRFYRHPNATQYSALALSLVVGSPSLMMTLKRRFLSFPKFPPELCVYSFAEVLLRQVVWFLFPAHVLESGTVVYYEIL